MEIKLSTVTSIRDNQPVDRVVSYEELCQMLSNFTSTSKKHEDAPGFISGHFNGRQRLTKNLHSKSLLVLDLDHFNGSISDLEYVLKRDLGVYKYISHSTVSHSPEAPRLRIVLFLITEVNADEYHIIATNFIRSLGKDLQNAMDLEASTTFNKVMILPTKPSSDYQEWYQANDGLVIDTVLFGKRIIYPEDNNDPLLIATVNQPINYSTQEITTCLQNYSVEECDYYAWLEVGSALHHQYRGGIEGFTLWDEWSKKDKRSGKYPGSTVLKTKWNSFNVRKNKPVTFRTIIYKSNLKRKPKKYEPICPSKWIHTKGKSLVPIFSEENFEILLREYNIDISFDIIKKDIVISFDKVLHKNINNSITKIKLLCQLNKFSTALVHETINLIAHQNRTNSWKTWIDSKSWDGLDRFDHLCETIKVLPEFEQIKRIYLKRWLIQMLHMTCLNDEEAPKSARTVLILQGAQNIGKTTWLTSLAPKSMSDYILIGQSLNSSNDMDILGCIKNVFVELGEVTSTFRKTDIENLKNFISRPVDSLNIKYIPLPEQYRRTTVFFGTTNETNFLSDSSGNSRFLVLPVLSCDPFHTVDTQQLYAQLLEEARTITNYNLLKEEYFLQTATNSTFENLSALEEKFLEIFDIDEDPSLHTKVYTATRTLEALGINITQMLHKKNTLNEMGSILNKFNFRKSSKPKGWFLPPQRFPMNTH